MCWYYGRPAEVQINYYLLPINFIKEKLVLLPLELKIPNQEEDREEDGRSRGSVPEVARLRAAHTEGGTPRTRGRDAGARAHVPTGGAQWRHATRYRGVPRGEEEKFQGYVTIKLDSPLFGPPPEWQEQLLSCKHDFFISGFRI